MLSPECKKGPDLKPVDPDEIICIEISQISSSIDYLELITPTKYKIKLTFLDKILPCEDDGIFDMTSRSDKIYHINLSYSLCNKNHTEDLVTDICNNPVEVEFYKIFDPTKMIKIGQNQIQLTQAIYDNLTDAEGKLEFLATVPVLNIKPVYFNYKIINRTKLDSGVFDNFIKLSITPDPKLADYKIAFLYPMNGQFKKKIFLGADNNYQFIGFIDEINRLLLLSCSLNDQCIVIELKTDTNHYIGLFELNKLLPYETNFILTILLFEFNWNVLKTRCNYSESVFKGHASIMSVETKSKNEKKKKSKEKKPKDPPPLVDVPILVPVFDEENNQLSIEVNLSLKYPLIIKERNSQWRLSQLLANEDENAEEGEDKITNDETNVIQSLILTQDINPQQMKDQLITVMIPLLNRTHILDLSDTKDRKTILLTLYFKLKELIADESLKLMPPQEDDPKRLDKNLLFMAEEFYVFDRQQQANQFYLMYLKENEFSENSLLEYITYNLKIKDFEMVNLCCKRLLNLNSSNVIGLLIQSYMNFKLTNYMLCEKILFEICKISPGFIHALVILYLLQIKTEKHTNFSWMANEISKSEKMCHCGQFETNRFEFCWTSPNPCDTFFNSAIFFINVGLFSFAEIALSYNQLIQDNLRNDRFYLLSIIDFEQKNYKASLTHFKKYQLSHQTIYKFKFNLLYHLKDFENWYDFFKNVVTDLLWMLPPVETRQFYLRLAWHFVNTNKFKEAKLYLDQIPEDVSTYLYWIAMGKCFIGLGQFREAEHCFINANVIDKLAKEPWVYLNDIYERLDQKPQAAICRNNIYPPEGF